MVLHACSASDGVWESKQHRLLNENESVSISFKSCHFGFIWDCNTSVSDCEILMVWVKHASGDRSKVMSLLFCSHGMIEFDTTSQT